MMPAQLAIVIPTFNESENVIPLVEQLISTLRGVGRLASTEVLFVDDSTDETPQVISRVADGSELTIRLIHRAPGERVGGLGGAVVAGIQNTCAATVVVMDGDLQHPPGTIPRLLNALDGYDVAVASRYCGEGGDAAGLSSKTRKAVSSSSTVLARTLFPRRLRDCTDPMTGYFAVRRGALDVTKLRPIGFKILLEILVRHRLRVIEIPFEFADRHAGESKASIRQGLRFVWQLANLRFGSALSFMLVGASGLAVNVAVMATAISAGLNYVASSIVATELSIVWNFVLCEKFVFRDRRVSTAWRRGAQCFLYNNLEFALRLPFLMVAVSVLGIGEVLAQFVTVVIAFFARYAFTSRVVYRTDGAPIEIGAKATAVMRSVHDSAVLPADATITLDRRE
ncbi:UNVERIFIED_CONTAM: dolichol-phosphate mannosyltransferase [Williamsia faeni]